MNTPSEIVRALLARHADELLWQSGAPSPCMSICQIKLSLGRCVGCHRTLEEIAQWPDMNEVQKRQTWARLLARAQPAASANGKGESSSA